MNALDRALAEIDWDALGDELDERGYALTPRLLDDADCAALAALYADDARFRSTVVMARHGFGRGQYRYFSYPLPPLVAELRAGLYRGLARIANRWETRLGTDRRWSAEHTQLLADCHAAGQQRPTPLLLRYGVGDYNCLHQDLYGPLHFPLQAIALLDTPGVDFDGGTLTLVETRPRMQSRCETPPLARGQFALIPVRDRPRPSARGYTRAGMRHGVSSVTRGLRRTLGIIFHDAA
jgi:hypothetical protein